MYDAHFDTLKNVSNENFDGALMSISQIVDYFNFLHFPKINILKTKQYVQSMPFCMYFRKHSYLLQPFNDHLNSMSSGGLIVIWQRKYVRSLQQNDQKEPQAVNLDQITGVIIVCICLFGTSLIVFIFELMSSSHGTIKSVLDFFTFKGKNHSFDQTKELSVKNAIKW